MTDVTSKCTLASAAYCGDISTVQAASARGLDINRRGSILLHGERRRISPLLAAAASPSEAAVPVLKWLLDHGADWKATDKNGQDALDFALEDTVETGTLGDIKLQMAHLLLAAGLDVAGTDGIGRTRLMRAARQRNERAVRFLLERGAPTAARDNAGRSALHWACWRGESRDSLENSACRQVIELLLTNGSDLRWCDIDGRRPLHYAADGDWGCATAVEALLKNGDEVDPVDCNGATPLFLATEAGELECVSLLLEGGACPNLRTATGATAIDAAREHVERWEAVVAHPEVVDSNIENRHKSAWLHIAGNGGAWSGQMLHRARAMLLMLERLDQ